MRFLICLLIGILQIAPLAAQDYPNRPIHIIAPFGPGTATDTVARVIAAELTRLTGQAAIVDNKPGAEGQIGAQAAATAPPDARNITKTGPGNLIISGANDGIDGVTVDASFNPVAAPEFAMVAHSRSRKAR